MLLLFASFVLVLSGTSYVKCVSDSGEESFKDCLIAKPSEGLGYCLGVGTLNKLQTLENDPDFGLVDGVRLYKDEQQYRESYNFVATSDPRSLR